MTEFRIWWTSQDDAERVALLHRSQWPWYLRRQFSSRYGRNGRGRLWVSPDIDREQPGEVHPWNEADPICQWAGDAGGIVIKAADWPHVANLPGFVTTFDMRLAIYSLPTALDVVIAEVEAEIARQEGEDGTEYADPDWYSCLNCLNDLRALRTEAGEEHG